ncbi:hypothetical protein O0544_01975 [Edwardsiella anguillarum]|nr:hypothetical protein [Edwardsiella anguillarum]
METCFKLTLLNGPLRGQALRLPAGEFTLGGREENDLHLALESGGSASLSVTARASASLPLPPAGLAAALARRTPAVKSGNRSRRHPLCADRR